jgi:CheY-like chemotaxis protein
MDQGELVLLVDAEGDVRAALREMLKMLGYRVLEARSGREAERLAAQYPDQIHLLLTDVLMPDMNGPELARIVCGRRPETKVMFVSGYMHEMSDWAGLLARGTRLVPKPLHVDELKQAIREVLAEPLPFAPSIVVVRVGEPRRLGGTDDIPMWQLELSGVPDEVWRRLFLKRANASGIFYGSDVSVEGSAVIFQIERGAVAIARDRIDAWIGEVNGLCACGTGAEVSASGEPVKTSGPTLFVVDDEAVSRETISAILRDAGYQVIEASDPTEALRLARARPERIDLLVLDVVMPMMNGPELGKRILQLRPTAKVLLISGYDTAAAVSSGWPILRKPATREGLIEAVSAVLENRWPDPSPFRRGPSRPPIS